MRVFYVCVCVCIICFDCSHIHYQQCDNSLAISQALGLPVSLSLSLSLSHSLFIYVFPCALFFLFICALFCLVLDDYFPFFVFVIVFISALVVVVRCSRAQLVENFPALNIKVYRIKIDV